MNHHSSTIKKCYLALVGTALITASLFQFSLPVFAAGTAAGQIIRNTATGTYEDNDGNDYTIDSNTVEITVAKVAGITNIPTGFTDETNETDDPTNTSVLTGDTVSFEFTITNVGNDKSDIYIPGTAANIKTKGLSTAAADFKVEVSGINPGSNPSFLAYPSAGIVKDVPVNGKIIVKVTSKVTATVTGAPIEVQLGDTGSNTDPNFPVADTQNQFDDGGSIAGYPDDVKVAANEVRTLNPTSTPTSGVPNPNLDPEQQKEASAVKQVSLGSNPQAMVKIEKTREIDDTLVANTNTPLNDNVITYKLGLEVLNNSPSAQFTPGKLKGRDLSARLTSTTVNDKTNLVLVSDAIPDKTRLKEELPVSFTDNDGRTWTAVYTIADSTVATNDIEWETTAPDLTDVTRVGWVYNANSTQDAIDPGTIVSGFTFDVVTTGLTASGGDVANLAQVFGSTDGGSNVFDESGDQDPSNFSGPNPGPSETDSGSTGIADPANHGVDTDNNNSATASPGGEDNVITIGAPGALINGPNGKPEATGKIFDQGPDNNHDFQNKGIGNFDSVSCAPATISSGNAQSGKGCKLNPDAIEFTNTFKNPGLGSLSNVLLQPVKPSDILGGTDAHLPNGTKVTIKYGTLTAVYNYTLSGATGSFALDTSIASNAHIKITSMAAGVSLDYTVTIDLPANTELSTDVGHGYAVPIIAFVDSDNDNILDAVENRNYTVNQVYTDFIKIEKQVKVLKPDGTLRAGMDFADNSVKNPLPGDTLVYRVNYRNISELQTGNGGNLVLDGKSVMIDENGTQAGITSVGGTSKDKGNNWGLDNNGDGDLDTINVQNSATDSSSGSTVNYYTGASPESSTDKYSVDTLTSAGTTDPGETVTGYRVTIPTLAPSTSKSTFEFQRKVDEYDGLAQEGLN
jgi:hypothetical protein